MADKNVTVRPAGGTYTTLHAAYDGEIVANPVLTAAGLDGVLTIQIEGDWSGGGETNGSNLEISGFTSDATHYLVIQTDSSNKAGTSWTTSKYSYSYTGSWNPGLYVAQNYIKFIGLQVRNTGVNSASVISYAEHGALLDSCLLANATCPGEYALNCYGGGSVAASTVRNVVIMNVTGGGITNANTTNLTIDNCTVVNTAGIGINTGVATTTITNCYSGGNVGADFAGAAGTLTDCYSEDETRSTEPCAYDTENFTNVGDGTEDVALVAGSALIDVGTDLHARATWPFAYDIVGTARPNGSWDVGSYEYVASGGGVSIQAYATYYANMRIRNKMHTDDSDLL